MSSLSSTQADGYYIPPQYLDSGVYKKKSVSQFNNGKPTKAGHNQFLQRSVVRFELPYDGFCKNSSCKAHVGRGTRFNAHKAHVDDYHSTKIWEFTMKCRACAVGKFVIRTNPKGRCFDYIMGIHKKVEEFDTLDAGTCGVIDTDRGNGIHPSTTTSSNHLNGANDNHNNPLEKLEKRITGERKAMTERDAMQLLLDHNKTTMYDDASSNSALRETYRTVRNAKKRRLRNAQHVGLGKGIELPDDDTIVMTKEEDRQSRQHFLRGGCGINLSREREISKFASIRSASIFSDGGRRHQINDKKMPGRRSSKIRVGRGSTINGILPTSALHVVGDNNTCQRKIKTKERAIEVKGIEQKSNTNSINGDKNTAIFAKVGAPERDSLLVLGDYDSDSS